MSDATMRVALVREYREAVQLSKQFEAVAAERRAEILAVIPPGETVEIEPGFGITVASPRMVFDPIKAEQQLPAADFQRICAWVPSAQLARKLLPPRVVDSLTTPAGGPIVRMVGT